jgi:hypothetical protein
VSVQTENFLGARRKNLINAKYVFASVTHFSSKKLIITKGAVKLSTAEKVS